MDVCYTLSLPINFMFDSDAIEKYSHDLDWAQLVSYVCHKQI